jgi:MoxR-like ATPase
METVKAGRPAIELIKLCYAANRSLMFVGRHGVGKSELLEQAAAEMGIQFISRDLSLMEPPDLIGLPKMNGRTTKYLPPEFLPTNGKGLLVFEELNRCERYMRAPCLQLLTGRVLNDYQLPPGWLPLAAINPPTADYETFDLDPALLARFVLANLVADQQEWLQWAARKGIHSGVIDYVERDPSVFDAPQSNPRAWSYVSDIVSVAERDGTDARTLRRAVVGLVGGKRGAAFLATLRHGDGPLKPELLLASYGSRRSVVRGWIASGKLDVVKATVLALKKYLQPKRDYEAVREDARQWKNLAMFLHDLPGDLLDGAKKYFAQRNYEFPKRPKTRR